MQTLPSKIFTIIFIAISSSIYAQNSTNLLSIQYKADSLFNKKKYTQSFFIYDSLYTQKSIYTPQMLLKMAYTKEGLGDYSKALCYLETLTYHLQETSLLQKINQLAEKHKLSGYNYSDIDLLKSFITHYHESITFWSVVFSIAGTIVLIFYIITNKQKGFSIITTIVTICIVTSLMANNAINLFNKHAIITKNTFAMADASPAAAVINPVKKGTKVEYIKSTDSWTKVLIDDKEVFIKSIHIYKTSPY